ncbi:MAG TPA: protein translocase subunit SecF [bacterium]|nr:protein translocase subunit SecF [bacterium]HMW32071.1 protein translocase subunit SecF [bacterium]HMW34912.1 protein translocase subunit SecF [bacterium]HMY36584.1 protein translocase subunit SecF [bacterium]HMZ03693.1 protein translocase subunit SecF [bacterium]
MELFVNKNYPLVDTRRNAYIFSGLLILISLLLFFFRGLNYGVDFVGGTSIEVKFSSKVELEKVRSIVSSKYSSDRIQDFGNGNEVLIHVLEQNNDVAPTVLKLMNDNFPGNSVELRSVSQVGPKIGDELKVSAIWASIWGLLFIVVYLAIRFHWKWGMAAVAALFHDVIITIGLFCALQLEFSLGAVAALLTIIGYSVNDTIVVFDRIRENTRLIKRGTTFGEVINKSINETLSRTVMTSALTLLSVIVLLMIGGEVIRTFAWALLTGIVVGTYSSIYVASPILIEWNAGEDIKVK